MDSHALEAITVVHPAAFVHNARTYVVALAMTLLGGTMAAMVYIVTHHADLQVCVGSRAAMSLPARFIERIASLLIASIAYE